MPEWAVLTEGAVLGLRLASAGCPPQRIVAARSAARDLNESFMRVSSAGKRRAAAIHFSRPHTDVDRAYCLPVLRMLRPKWNAGPTE